MQLHSLISLLDEAAAWISPDGQIAACNTHAAAAGLAAGSRIGMPQLAWLKPVVDEALHAKTRTCRRNAGGAGEQPQWNIFAAALFGGPAGTAGVLLLLRPSSATPLPAPTNDDPLKKILSSLAHDLKTPLTSIQMSVHLLLEDAATRLAPRQLELLEAARDDSDRLQRKVEELLAKTRPPEK